MSSSPIPDSSFLVPKIKGETTVKKKNQIAYFTPLPSVSRYVIFITSNLFVSGPQGKGRDDSNQPTNNQKNKKKPTTTTTKTQQNGLLIFLVSNSVSSFLYSPQTRIRRLYKNQNQIAYLPHFPFCFVFESFLLSPRGHRNRYSFC